VRAGGAYRIAMQPPDAAAFFLTGEFRDVVPPAHLSYTFRWEDADPDDQETVVSLSFEDLGDSTNVIVEQGPFSPTRAEIFMRKVGEKRSTVWPRSSRLTPKEGDRSIRS
jgi:uncharacterized protein YndB with AHSA1/START domain